MAMERKGKTGGVFRPVADEREMAVIGEAGQAVVIGIIAEPRQVLRQKGNQHHQPEGDEE